MLPKCCTDAVTSVPETLRAVAVAITRTVGIDERALWPAWRRLISRPCVVVALRRSLRTSSGAVEAVELCVLAVTLAVTVAIGELRHAWAWRHGDVIECLHQHLAHFCAHQQRRCNKHVLTILRLYFVFLIRYSQLIITFVFCATRELHRSRILFPSSFPTRYKV